MLQGPYQQLKLDIKAALFIVKYLHKRMTSERKLTSKELKKILGEILLNPFLTLEMLKIFFVLQKLDTLDIYFLFFFHLIVNMLLSNTVESLKTVVKYLEDCTEVAIHENKDRFDFHISIINYNNHKVY